jgi:hypothetical protein
VAENFMSRPSYQSDRGEGEMATATDRALAPNVTFRRAMWIALIVLCVIGGAAAIRRMTALAFPPRRPPAEFGDLDAQFAAEPMETLVHIVPALALVILIPFQFSRTFRQRHLRAHRWMGRVAMVLSLVIGISGLVLIRHPVGGGAEVAAILFFDALFLVALAKAFVHIRRKEVAQHREWVIRAMSVAVGVATVRPIMGVFFATSRMTGLTPHEFFGIAFWIGFTLTYIAGEWWIRFGGQRAEGRGQIGKFSAAD